MTRRHSTFDAFCAIGAAILMVVLALKYTGLRDQDHRVQEEATTTRTSNAATAVVKTPPSTNAALSSAPPQPHIYPYEVDDEGMPKDIRLVPTLAEMLRPNEGGWEVPWAFGRDEAGQYYYGRNGLELSDSPGGTTEVLLFRLESGHHAIFFGCNYGMSELQDKNTDEGPWQSLASFYFIKDTSRNC